MFPIHKQVNKKNDKSPCERVFAAMNSFVQAMKPLSKRTYPEMNLIRSRTIALMVPNLANAFYAEVFRGIESVAVQSGFTLYVCPTYQSPEKESGFIEDLAKNRVGGLIVFSASLKKCNILKKASGIMRIVSIQSDIKGVDFVSVTDEQGMFEATKHLLQSGHKQIAFIGYDNNIAAVNNRISGYKAALQQYDISVDENLIFREHTSSSGYITAKNLLASQNRPTAVQCANDHLAMGVYMAADELGLRIPHDLSVSGFDNTVMSRLMIPQLTTVAQPAFEMGEMAARLIIKRIIGDDRSAPRSVVLPTKHIIRDSTAKACK